MRLHVIPPSYLSGVAALSRFFAISSPYGPMCTMMELSGGEEAHQRAIGMSSGSSNASGSSGGAVTPRSSPSPHASPRVELEDASSSVTPPKGTQQHLMHVHDGEVDEELEDDGEISVGCPSPRPSSRGASAAAAAAAAVAAACTLASLQSAPSSCCSDDATTDDDYFKPLKKLKMMQLEQERREKSPPIVPAPPPPAPIPQHHHHHHNHLHNHHALAIPTASVARPAAAAASRVKSFSILDILSHRPVRQAGFEMPTRIVRPWDLGSPPAATMAHSRRRPQSADSSSGRSAAESEDCGDSPAPPGSTPSSATSSGHHHHPRGRNTAGGSAGGSNNTSPLDALFQMTSKTFEGLNGSGDGEGSSSHLNLFNSRQQPKKKRKSRTAFTNHQIFELEKRFLYQKYLSPADRDEIAQQLGLSNAQVITWFQNRRAKLKRDMEELKKDVESAKILTAHKSFLENVQDLGLLKKKVEDCKTAAAAAAAVAAAAAAAASEK